MGYVHDTAMARLILPADCAKSAGTWTPTTGTQIWYERRTAAASAPVVFVPVRLPQNSVAQKGSLLKSIDIWYEISTAAATAITAAIYKRTLPADATAYGTPAAQTFTYDAGHDTAAERLAVQKHKMTLTLSTPVWIDDDDQYFVELTVDFSGAGTGVFDLHAARMNYTARL